MRIWVLLVCLISVVSSQDTSYPYVVLDDIWTPIELEQLRALWQDVNGYQTFKEDATSSLSHIGEMTPARSDGSCPHRYLTPRTINSEMMCVLPDRIDVAHHHFKSGGIAGRKETFSDLVGRLLAFNKILHRDSLSSIPEMKSLFESPKYLAAVEKICPHKPILDPIQLGIVILVPGQEVAVHYDVPWFSGATRFDFPQWLLVAMHRSGLFESVLTPQIQGVAYIHTQTLIGGEFVFWDEGINAPPKSISAQPNTGIILDGSLVVHGVNPFGPFDTSSLKMTPHHRYEFQRNISTDRWQVSDMDRQQGLGREYEVDELRVSLVWRSRCFGDEEERKKWHHAAKMDPASVLDILQQDLKHRGVLTTASISSLDLALLIIDTYIDYPWNSTVLIPWNYCLISSYSKLAAFLLGCLL